MKVPFVIDATKNKKVGDFIFPYEPDPTTEPKICDEIPSNCTSHDCHNLSNHFTFNLPTRKLIGMV